MPSTVLRRSLSSVRSGGNLGTVILRELLQIKNSIMLRDVISDLRSNQEDID